MISCKGIDKTQEIYNIETNFIYKNVNKINTNKKTLSSKTIDLIRKRKELLINRSSKTTLQEITKLSKEIRSNIKQDKHS